jgi:hypothetical protein
MSYYQEEDPSDDRNWSEEECECGESYDMGPPWYHTKCHACRKRAKEQAAACKVKMEAIRMQVRDAMTAEVRP